MSKKGLEKFYKEALPTLLKTYKNSKHYNNIYFDEYDAKCYIKKSNGQIEEVIIFDIEGVEYMNFGNATLNRLLNPFTKPCVHIMGSNSTYRWADDYGKTWTLKKEDLETKSTGNRKKLSTQFVIQYPTGKQSKIYRQQLTAQAKLDKDIKNLEDWIDFASKAKGYEIVFGPGTGEEKEDYKNKELEKSRKELNELKGAKVIQLA